MGPNVTFHCVIEARLSQLRWVESKDAEGGGWYSRTLWIKYASGELVCYNIIGVAGRAFDDVLPPNAEPTNPDEDGSQIDKFQRDCAG
jgi:hypothetical protein